MKPPGPRSRPSREWSRFGPLNFALWLPVGFLLFLGLGAFTEHLPPAIPVAYAACGLLTVAFYARDKSKAQRDEWRTPEFTLHLLDFLGGWPGGLIAQRVFRHKTQKVSFQVMFWLCVVVHLVAWGWIFVAVPAEADFFRFVARVAGTVKAMVAK